MRTRTRRSVAGLVLPGRRGLAGVAGLLLGAGLGTSLALVPNVALSGAGLAPVGSAPPGSLLDATHLPPLLTRAGEAVDLRYDIHCAAAVENQADATCGAGGTVFLRSGNEGPYGGLPLRTDPDAVEGRYVARVPDDIATSRDGFTYYAVLRSQSGDTLTLPAGGPAAPQRSIPLDRTVEVRLGTHVFGAVRDTDARVVEAAWGSGPIDVGLEQGRNLPAIGPASFDVDASGAVHLLDQAHRRILRWRGAVSEPVPVPLAIDGTLADLSIDGAGGLHVLEMGNGGRAPVLRTFDRSGNHRSSIELSERTASQVRIGPEGPIVHQQPSGHWMPTAIDGQVLSPDAQVRSGRPGRRLTGGGEIVLLRHGNEIRVAIGDARGARRSWRVVSDTPVAEVQLAEPLGHRLVLVARLYDDAQDEFLALVLGSRGLVRSFSLASADWAETAPLSRFRLVGSSLYQLGSTRAGVFVDRFDLEAS